MGDRHYQKSQANKGGGISVKSKLLDQADKLNGVEWQGIASFNFTGAPCQLAQQNQGYGEWRNTGCINDVNISMEKKGGRWSILFLNTWVPVDSMELKNNPLTCEEALNPTGRW